MLKDKVIAITGGARGIGLSIALHLKALGAHIALFSRSAEDLKLAQVKLDEINSLPSLCLACDVTQQNQVQNFFNQASSRFGHLNGLICAAGVYGSIGNFIKMPFNEWGNAIDINLKGTALAIHSAYPFFDKSKAGKIILFSGGGQGPLANFSAYAASKGAIWRMTETLGEELASERIYVNAIAPGAVNTKFLDELLAAGKEQVGEELYKKSTDQKKQGGISPLKAAELAAWLLSSQSDGLYGKTLSAVWDPYKDFNNLEEMSKSAIYQVRRVVDFDGNTSLK